MKKETERRSRKHRWNPEVAEEGSIMTAMVRKVRNAQIPPHQLHALGLNSDWSKNVSPRMMERAVRTAEKYKGVIKELAKK